MKKNICKDGHTEYIKIHYYLMLQKKLGQIQIHSKLQVTLRDILLLLVNFFDS